MLLASASSALPGCAFLAVSPSIVIDHAAHFAIPAIQETTRLAFASEVVFGGLLDAAPDYPNRFITGLERFKGPAFISGVPAQKIAPALATGVFARVARTLMTSSLHCMLQQGVVIAAGSHFYETYFTSDRTLLRSQPLLRSAPLGSVHSQSIRCTVQYQ